MVDTKIGGYGGEKTTKEFDDIFKTLGINSQQKVMRGRIIRVYKFSTQNDMKF